MSQSTLCGKEDWRRVGRSSVEKQRLLANSVLRHEACEACSGVYICHCCSAVHPSSITQTHFGTMEPHSSAIDRALAELNLLITKLQNDSSSSTSEAKQTTQVAFDLPLNFVAKCGSVICISQFPVPTHLAMTGEVAKMNHYIIIGCSHKQLVRGKDCWKFSANKNQ